MYIPTALDISLIVNFVLFIGLLASLVNRGADIDCQFDLIAKDNRISELESMITEMIKSVDEINRSREQFNIEGG